MPHTQADTPENLIESFFAAFNRGDLEALLALYEPQGTLVAQPGMVAQGSAALREALLAFLAMKPNMQRHASTIVVAHDVALALTRWTLDGTGPDSSAIQMGGEATDVLRRQPNGSWRVVLDNPWGVTLLAPAAG